MSLHTTSNKRHFYYDPHFPKHLNETNCGFPLNLNTFNSIHESLWKLAEVSCEFLVFSGIATGFANLFIYFLKFLWDTRVV